MKKNKRILTEAERQADSIKRQKAIVESFSNEFNKIKRINEDDVDDLKLVSFINENRDLADARARGYRENPEAAEMTDFLTQHEGKLKELYSSFLESGGEIEFMEFVVFIFKNGQDLVMDPTMNEQDPVGDGFGAEYEQDNTFEFVEVELNNFDYDGEHSYGNTPEYANASLIFSYIVNDDTVSYLVNIPVECNPEDGVDNSTNREFSYTACYWDGTIDSVFDENSEEVDESVLNAIKNTIKEKPEITYMFTEELEDIAEQYWANYSPY